MKRYGLKLWSNNDFYIDTARNLYNDGIYDYIELYAVPGTYNEYIQKWQALNIPYIIHAPHFAHGINFSIKEQEKENLTLAETAFLFADSLSADKVIFHPGIKGDYKETARQLRLLNDPRVVIENKPYNVAIQLDNLSPNDICVGAKVEEMKYILEETGFGFCLDIGHGICAANSLNINYIDFLKDFLKLQPIMYHLSDGLIDSPIDKHLNIGKGTFDFNVIYSLLPETAVISVETHKASKENLNDFIEDVKQLRKYS